MARLVSWAIIILACLGVASLVALPLLAEGAARRADFPPPDALPPDPQLPEKRDKPVIPVDELHAALRLPRVDSTLTDKHSKEALAAYEAGDYEKAFEEAVLSLDPAPLGKNELYRVLTNPDSAKQGWWVQSPHAAVEEVLRPILRSQNPREAAARLNNVSALMTLRDYGMGPSAIPFGLVVSQELAAQAADLRPSYCPALLNLTLYGNAGQAGAFFRPLDFDTDDDLNPAGIHMITTPDHYRRSTLNENYPVEGCNEDPALLYYMAQESVGVGIPPGTAPGSGESKVARAKAFRQIDRLQAIPGWAGLAHSVRGDAYYWFGIYALERAQYKQPFTARRYFELALTEYDVALRLQPDDTALHHGKALAYLELGETDKAIREAKTALKADPDSLRLQQTVIGAYEEKGLYASAARLNRNFLSKHRPPSPPLSLVPYSAISHGADRYWELAILSSVGGGPAAFIDNEVIVKFVPRGYISKVASKVEVWSVPNWMIQRRKELRHYLLLRDILLSGNYGALNEQLSRAPEEVQDNDRVLLLAAMDSLLNQPQDKVTPTEKTQASIDDFLAATGPADEAEWSDSAYPPGPLPLRANDLFYLEAGNFFRQYERYGVAIRVYRIWQTELEQAGADDDRLAEVQRLLGEAHFLKGEADSSNQEDPTNEYDAAVSAFNEAARLRGDWPPFMVRQAFMQEKLGKYEAAEDLYRDALGAMRQPTKLTRKITGDPIKYYYPDNYQAYKHLGDVLIRQAAGAERSGSDARSVRGGYAEAAKAYRDAMMMEFKKGGFAATFSETAAPAAVSNLGVTLLKAGSHEKGVKVLETLVRPFVFYGAVDDQETRIRERTEVLTALMDPQNVPEQWYKSYEPGLPIPDNQNPIFHLDLGWGYELSGEANKAKEQYLAAVKSDASFYPALNDLGVMAAEEGNLEEAKKYFYEALNQESDYAYASHNLGVALLDSGGMGNFLAAQGFLARAADQDSSLAEIRYGYIFDHELNFLNLSLGTNVPGDWEFAARAERSAFYVSVGAAILILWRIVRRTAYESGRETLFGRIFGFVQERYGGSILRYWTRVRDGWLRISRLGSPSRGWWLVTPLALVVSALALAIAQGWSLLWEESVSRLVMVATLLYVAFVSLLVHHAGHAVVALRSRLQVREAPWLAGLAQAIVLGALSGPFIAPMPATSVEGEAEERRRQLVFFAGPLASIFMAVLLYALYLASHVPLFNFGAVLNVALAAASLLSLPPLEGTEISEGYYTRWAFWAAMFVTVITALIAWSGYL